MSCLEISPDGLRMASCQEGEKPVLRIWDLNTGKCLNKFGLNIKEVRCLSFSSDAKLLCAIGNDKLGRDEILIIEIEEKDKDSL